MSPRFERDGLRGGCPIDAAQLSPPLLLLLVYWCCQNVDTGLIKN